MGTSDEQTELLRRLVESQERMERLGNRPGCLEFTPRGCGCILALLSPQVLLAILAKLMPPPNMTQESQRGEEVSSNYDPIPASVYHGPIPPDIQPRDVIELIGSPGQTIVKFHLSPGLTRKPPNFGLVKMFSYLHYSKISVGFRAFSEISSKMTYISRLVKV